MKQSRQSRDLFFLVFKQSKVGKVETDSFSFNLCKVGKEDFFFPFDQGKVDKVEAYFFQLLARQSRQSRDLFFQLLAR